MAQVTACCYCQFADESKDPLLFIDRLARFRKPFFLTKKRGQNFRDVSRCRRFKGPWERAPEKFYLIRDFPRS